MNEIKRPPYKGGTATKTAYLGLFMALAILMGYVEAIIPVQMPVPGMKLGLPNLVIAAVLYLYSWKEAIIICATLSRRDMAERIRSTESLSAQAGAVMDPKTIRRVRIRQIIFFI